MTRLREWTRSVGLDYAKVHFRATPLGDIKRADVQTFIYSLCDRQLAPATVRRYVAGLSSLLQTAFNDGHIDANPASPWRFNVPDRRGTVTKKPRNYLTRQDVTTLLEAVDESQHDLVLFVARTGCRISEALNATWGCVFDDGGEDWIAFGKSKTEAGLTPIPLTKQTAQMLTDRKRSGIVGTADDDPIFPNSVGRVWDRRTWTSKYWRPAATKAGLVYEVKGKIKPWATPHMLRHGLATRMAERGASGREIARSLRHADGGRLAQLTYAHDKATRNDWLDDDAEVAVG